MIGLKIAVRYFAVVREITKRDKEEIEVSSDATAQSALDRLKKMYPELSRVLGQCRIAVNQDFVDPLHQLQPGDELVLIPPVAGGQDRILCQISGDPLSIDRSFRNVSSPAHGGICLFVGVVRNHSQGKEVADLHYEAYGEMARKVIERICAEAEANHQDTRCYVEHRVGQLTIGDLAVVVAAASAHRGPAFAACREIIEELKKHAPIWKKERSSDGVEWVGLGP